MTWPENLGVACIRCYGIYPRFLVAFIESFLFAAPITTSLGQVEMISAFQFAQGLPGPFHRMITAVTR